MATCSVKTCSNRIRDAERNRRDGITFHRFPIDTTRRKHWIEACGQPKAFKPTAKSVICSVHFEEIQFKQTPKGPILFPVAIPFLFLPTTRIEEICRKRKTRIPIHEAEIIRSTDEQFNLFCKISHHNQFVLDPAYILKVANKIAESSNDIANHMLAIAVRNTVGHATIETTYSNPYETDIQKNLYILKHHVPTDVYDESPLCYKCYACSNFWWHLEEFREHLRSHQGIHISADFFDGISSLVAYESNPSIMNYNLKVKCPKCGKYFDSQQFKSHLHCRYCIKRHRRIKGKKYYRTGLFECNICARYFDTDENFEQHLTGYHDVRSDIPIKNERWMVCKYCNERYQSKYHHYCVNEGPEVSCSFCFRSFVNSSLAQEHIQNNQGLFFCEICGEQLASDCMKFEHMLPHSNKYTIVQKCTLCTGLRVFISSDALSLHLYVHHDKFMTLPQHYYRSIIIPKSCLNQESRRICDDMIDKKPKVVTENEEEINIDNMPLDVDDVINDIGKLDEEFYDKMNVDENPANTTDLNKPAKKHDTNAPEPDKMEIEMLEEEFDEEFYNEVCIDENQETGIDSNVPTKNIYDVEPEVEMLEEEFDKKINDEINADEKPETVIDLNKPTNNNEAEVPIHNKISGDEPEHYAEAIIKLDYSTDEHVEIILVEEATVKKEVPEKLIKSLIQPIAETYNKIDKEETDATVETIVDQNKVTTEKTYAGKVIFKAKPITIKKEHLLRYSEATQIYSRDRSIDKSDNTYVRDILVQICKRCGSRLSLYKCTKCNVTFKSMKDCLDHFIYQSYHFFDCPGCHEVFYNTELLCQHIQSHLLGTFGFRHPNRQEICKVLVQLQDFCKHWESHIEIGKKYPERDNINDNDSNNDEDGVVGETPNRMHKVFKCNLCKSKFTIYYNYKMHLIDHFLNDVKTLLHGGINKAHLRVGGYATVVFTTLRNMKIHTDITLTCEACPKKSAKQDTRSTLADKTFKCDDCEKIFPKSELEAHMKEIQHQKNAECDKADDIYFDEITQIGNYSHEVEVVTEPEPFNQTLTSNSDLLETFDQVDSIDAIDPMLSSEDFSLINPQKTNFSETLESIMNKIDTHGNVLMFNKALDIMDSEGAIDLGDIQFIENHSLENGCDNITDSTSKIKDTNVTLTETQNAEASTDTIKIDKIDTHGDVLMLNKALDTMDSEGAIDLGDNQFIESNSLENGCDNITDSTLQIKNTNVTLPETQNAEASTDTIKIDNIDTHGDVLMLNKVLDTMDSEGAIDLGDNQFIENKSLENGFNDMIDIVLQLEDDYMILPETQNAEASTNTLKIDKIDTHGDVLMFNKALDTMDSEGAIDLNDIQFIESNSLESGCDNITYSTSQIKDTNVTLTETQNAEASTDTIKIDKIDTHGDVLMFNKALDTMNSEGAIDVNDIQFIESNSLESGCDNITYSTSQIKDTNVTLTETQNADASTDTIKIDKIDTHGFGLMLIKALDTMDSESTIDLNDIQFIESNFLENGCDNITDSTSQIKDTNVTLTETQNADASTDKIKIDKIDTHGDVLMFNKALDTMDSEGAIDLGDNQFIESISLDNGCNYKIDFTIQIKDNNIIIPETRNADASTDTIMIEQKRNCKRTLFNKSPKPTKCATDCRLNCNLLPDTLREEICNDYYWSLDANGRRSFIKKSKQQDERKKYPIRARKRDESRKYYLTEKGQNGQKEKDTINIVCDLFSPRHSECLTHVTGMSQHRHLKKKKRKSRIITS